MKSSASELKSDKEKARAKCWAGTKNEDVRSPYMEASEEQNLA